MTYPADTAATTAPTYRSILRNFPSSSRGLPLTWESGRSDDSCRAWGLSLPHGLTDGRVVNGPAEAHPPNAGFQKLFVVDPGEAHRHHLARVFGIRTTDDVLESASARLRDAGDPDYREHLPLLDTLCSTTGPERPAAYTVLSPVDPAHHHLIVPFLQDSAPMALPETPPQDTTAWDVSVAVHLLWLAHGGGLVTEDQCSGMLARALDLAQSTYSTWEDFADGVVVGRAVSDGRLDDSCVRFVHDIAVVLNHPDSPWFRLSLQA
ncbi:DUF1266 domain-containing protein [Corynebacterium glyciniphilum]|uniref:DUF1266 domain-containing protein n=1 Tax=Corynebacterium glyciniphilum TaxID=1404244 RepID=UPI003D9FFE82